MGRKEKGPSLDVRGDSFAVVAEGVETEAQLEFLRDHDCDELQGYLFAKPESASEFASHLERTKSERSDSE